MNDERITAAQQIAAAHAALSAVVDDGSGSILYPTIARAMAIPCGERAQGSFFLSNRERLLPIGVDHDGLPKDRSARSMLDKAAFFLSDTRRGWGNADAPFGWIEGGEWMTMQIRLAGTLYGGVVVTDIYIPVDDVLAGILTTIGSHVGALLRLRALLEDAERMATTDLLTGVATRRLFLKNLNGACESREPYLMLFCDLDNFKQINDLQGHEAGDRALKEAAEAMVRTVRPDEMVGRFGGDEFVVLVRASEDEAPDIARRLETALNDVGLGGSFGWAVAEGDAASVIRVADEAMYQKKSAKKRLRAVPDLPAR